MCARRAGKKRGGQRRLSADGYAALKREAELVRAESVHGYRPDLTLKRESRSADRVGARARIGGGLTESDLNRVASKRAREADQVESRRVHDERRNLEAHGFRLPTPLQWKDSPAPRRGDVNNNGKETS